MKNEICIRHGRGTMTIVAGAFFPASMVRIDKLLKVINLDMNREDLISDLSEILSEMSGNEMTLAEMEKDYFRANYDRVERLKNLAATGKHPNGQHLTREEWKEAKEAYKRPVKDLDDAVKHYERHKKTAQRLNKNRIYILTKCGRMEEK